MLLDGEDVTGLPAFKRPTNTVFQSYALFPHRNVEQNVAFGLQRQKVDKGEIAGASARSSSAWGSALRRSGGPRSSPAASSSAWRSRARS